MGIGMFSGGTGFDPGPYVCTPGMTPPSCWVSEPSLAIWLNYEKSAPKGSNMAMGSYVGTHKESAFESRGAHLVRYVDLISLAEDATDKLLLRLSHKQARRQAPAIFTKP